MGKIKVGYILYPLYKVPSIVNYFIRSHVIKFICMKSRVNKYEVEKKKILHQYNLF